MGHVSGAALVVHVPAARMPDGAALRWTIGIAGRWASPGERLAAPPGRGEVTIRLEATNPQRRIVACLRMPVDIAAHGITELRLHRSSALRPAGRG